MISPGSHQTDQGHQPSDTTHTVRYIENNNVHNYQGLARNSTSMRGISPKLGVNVNILDFRIGPSRLYTHSWLVNAHNIYKTGLLTCSQPQRYSPKMSIKIKPIYTKNLHFASLT
jgi:hypothetical protein